MVITNRDKGPNISLLQLELEEQQQNNAML
jgi:hypothetical protein